MNNFYNYIAYINDLPIYVGKGKGKRYVHCYKKFPNCEVILYNENVSEQEAFDWEIKKIEEIGLENLANKVPGGFGVDTISKNPNKQDICNRIAETVRNLHKQGVYPKEYWKSGVLAMQSEESIRKRSETQTGSKKNFMNKDEWCKNISESLKGEKNPNFGKKSCNRGKTFERTDETVALLAQNALNRPRYICPICEKNNLDGGNLSQHMNKKHQWTKEQVIEYKNNFTPKNDETNK
jgi:hypothetical protein